MDLKILIFAIIVSQIPLSYALTLTIKKASITDLGIEEVLVDYGMLIGTLRFKLGNYTWPPKEIWLLPAQVNPDEFSQGLKQLTILELPENLTFSTCRTAVYFNESLGYGFKIYNTQTTKQIFKNGTFCGLAYEGEYHVFAKY
jgi:hypothetical protein